MGWAVSLGVIIIAGIFLLFRHPLSMWTFGFFSRSQSQTSIEANATAVSSEKDTKDGLIAKPEFKGVDNDDGDDASSQTTPKAAATATRIAQVPVLNLDGDDTGLEGKSPYANGDAKEAPVLTPVSSAPAPAPVTPPNGSLMAPPPPRLATTPQQQLRKPASFNASGFLSPPKLKTTTPLRPPPSAASSLRKPPVNRVTTSTLTPTPRNSSRQVVLEPGHSPLDWAALTSNPRNNLRGKDLPPQLIKVTPSMLKTHHGRKGVDAWTSYKGKVYNITPYLPFHPGGKGELMRGAGKDSAKLFMEIHPWVNWDGMLAECVVGILVPENETTEPNNLDAMD